MSLHFSKYAIIFACGLIASSLAYAVEQPLTLAEAQRLAIERSKQLHGRDAGALASRENAIAARQLPDPVLSFGIDSLPVTTSDRFSLTNDNFTERRIGLSQSLLSSEKRQLRGARYEYMAEKAEFDKAADVAAIRRDTALAWLNLWYAEAVLKAVSDQIAIAKLEIQAADAGYRSNTARRSDVLATRSGVAVLEDKADDLVRQVRNARTMLARWIGSAAEAPLAALPSFDLAQDDNDVRMVHVLAEHPALLAIGKETDIAEAEAQLARKDKSADWTLEISYAQRGPAYSNFVSVGFSIPLQWDQKQRQDRTLSAKLALVDQARDELEEALRTHQAEVENQLADWHTGRERSKRYANELIPLAEQNIDAALTDYRAGQGSLVKVFAARRETIGVRIQALQVAQDTARAWAQLNYLIPEQVHGAMGTNPAAPDGYLRDVLPTAKEIQ